MTGLDPKQQQQISNERAQVIKKSLQYGAGAVGWLDAGCFLEKKEEKKRLKKKNGKKTQREEAIGKRVEEAHKLRQHSHLHIRIEVETVAVSGGGDQNK